MNHATVPRVVVRHLAFTLTLVSWMGWATVARADRVLLFPPTGDGGEVRLDGIDDALGDAIRAAGHEPISEMASAAGGPRMPPPTDANDLRAVAELHGATYVVVPAVRGAGDPFVLALTVAYAPASRVESLEADVSHARRAQRTRALMAAFLRPEGAGDAVSSLRTDEPTEEERRAAEEEASERRRADEQAAREVEARRVEAEARERARREEGERRRRERWDGRERYGAEGGSWLVAAGLGIRAIAAHAAQARGGVIEALELRGGRTIAEVKGLEVRASFDLMGGAASGFALGAGIAYLATPLEAHPFFVGGAAEIGYAQSTSGSRAGYFLARAAPMAAYRVADHLQVEVALAELGVLLGSPAAFTIGASARVGWRF